MDAPRESMTRVSIALGILALCTLLILLLSKAHRGEKEYERSAVRGAVKETRIIADHPSETKWGTQLTWRAEYKVAYSVQNREYAVWSDSGVRGGSEEEVRSLLPPSPISCWVRFDSGRPELALADCR